MGKAKSQAGLLAVATAAAFTFLFAGTPTKVSPSLTVVLDMIAALGGESFLKLSAFQVFGGGFLPRQTRVKINFAQKGEKLRTQIETSFWASTEGFDGTSGWRRFGREKPFKLVSSPLQLAAKNGMDRIRQLESDSVALGPDTLIDQTACRWLKTYDSLAGELWIFVEQKTGRPKELFSPGSGMAAGLGDYRLVQGVWFPHHIAVSRAGQDFLEVALDTVIINSGLPDSLFSFPTH